MNYPIPSVQTHPDTVLLFPLPKMVFFAATNKPLNIFDSRYVQMINDALEKETPVALAFAEEGRRRAVRGAARSSPVRSICGVGIVQLLERRDDGTLLVLLKGQGKIRVGRPVEDDNPYLSVEATWIEERIDIEPSSRFLLNRMTKEFLKWLESAVPDVEQREAFMDFVRTPQERINYMCSLMVLEPERQQILLEEDNLDERLKTLARFWEADRLRQSH
jgi:Lon protease-like protein